MAEAGMNGSSGGLSVYLTTSEIKELLDDSHNIYREIDKSIDEVMMSMKYLKESKYLSGKGAEGLAKFIEVVEQDIIKPGQAFNLKMFRSLKTVAAEFEDEEFINIQ